MSQVIEANCPILTNPPWKGGKAKYRLGLKPINLDEWFGMTEGTLVALNRDFRVSNLGDINHISMYNIIKNKSAIY